MRKTLLAFVFAIACAFPALATKMPSKEPFSSQEWQEYTQNVLVKIANHTEWSMLARQVKVKILIDDEPDVGSMVEDKSISITRGRIKLIDDEAEYVGVVGHEFGHIALKHPPTTIVSFAPGDGESVRMTEETDFTLFEKQEIEADEFAVELLKKNGYDPCARYRGFEELLRVRGVLLEKQHGPFNTILIRRLEILRRPCITSP